MALGRTFLRPRSGPSSQRAWAGSPEERNPSRTTPPNTEVRSRWQQQIRARGFACQDPDGVWERSAETRGLSFCHRLFLELCGTRLGRGSSTRRSTGRQAGRLQIRTFNRKLGSRSADASHRKQTKQPNPASQVSHKLPARKGGWGCRGNGAQLGQHQTRTAASGLCFAGALPAAGIPARTSALESAFISWEAKGPCHLGKDTFAVEFQMAPCLFCLQSCDVRSQLFKFQRTK